MSPSTFRWLRRPRVRTNQLTTTEVGDPNETQGLKNAMTSSRERMSAEAEGYRIERALMDCVAPPLEGGATQSISVLEQILGC